MATANFMLKSSISIVSAEYSPITDSLKPITEDEITRACEILSAHSYKWREIGEGLGFRAPELNDIASRPLLLHGAPKSFLSAMLSEWQQWVPGDHRGSSTFATLPSLRVAVDKAGLAVTAHELN
jgi:hypothetical protein